MDARKQTLFSYLFCEGGLRPLSPFIKAAPGNDPSAAQAFPNLLPGLKTNANIAQNTPCSCYTSRSILALRRMQALLKLR